MNCVVDFNLSNGLPDLFYRRVFILANCKCQLIGSKKNCIVIFQSIPIRGQFVRMKSIKVIYNKKNTSKKNIKIIEQLSFLLL